MSMTSAWPHREVNMDLSDFQKAIHERYGETDKASGSFFLLSVLLEECGELATAIRR